MSKKRKKITIVFMFNNSYSMAAAVATRSLLVNSDKQKSYEIFILQDDITEINKIKIRKVAESFENAKLHFITPEVNFSKTWSNIATRDYYSKECLYKLILPELFKKHQRIIVSDVDVVFKEDISPAIDMIDDYNYLLGYRPPGKVMRLYDNDEKITETIRKRLKEGIGAGFMVYNLEKMRRDSVQEKLLKSLDKYQRILIQPEQDIINIALNGRIGYLPLEYCFCTYLYNLYRSEDEYDFNPRGHAKEYLLKKYRSNLDRDEHYTKEEFLTAFNKPVQIHYASDCKPWEYLFTKRKLDWVRYLVKTPFFASYLVLLLTGNQKDIGCKKTGPTK